MSVPEDLIIQTYLRIPADVAAGLASGELFRDGGVVRNAASGAIHLLPKEVPAPVKAAQEAATRAVRAHPKVMVPVVAAVTAGTAIAAGLALVASRRRNADGPRAISHVEVDVPACVSSFEASLRAYLDAARDGALDAAIVDRLIKDLDQVRAWAEGPNTDEFSFKQLEPVFTLVIDHTATLARDYAVAPAALERHEPDPDAGMLLHLRQHLGTQKQILGAAG